MLGTPKITEKLLSSLNKTPRHSPGTVECLSIYLVAFNRPGLHRLQQSEKMSSHGKSEYLKLWNMWFTCNQIMIFIWVIEGSLLLAYYSLVRNNLMIIQFLYYINCSCSEIMQQKGWILCQAKYLSANYNGNIHIYIKVI